MGLPATKHNRVYRHSCRYATLFLSFPYEPVKYHRRIPTTCSTTYSTSDVHPRDTRYTWAATAGIEEKRRSQMPANCQIFFHGARNRPILASLPPLLSFSRFHLSTSSSMYRACNSLYRVMLIILESRRLTVRYRK